MVLGRTGMPEFGMRWHTDNALRGATRNSWSAGHTAGGSSGGDAAAVEVAVPPLTPVEHAMRRYRPMQARPGIWRISDLP